MITLNHGTYETTKPMKPARNSTYETHETVKSMKPIKLWNHETTNTFGTMKPLKPTTKPSLKPRILGPVHTYPDIFESATFSVYVRPSPFFFVYCRISFLILGRSVGKRKKQNKNNIGKFNWLELGGPVPQHHIRGAWKQQGVVTKSLMAAMGEGKIDFFVRIKRE